MERLILPVLTENLPIPQFQHGFRQMHSTVSALSDLNEAVIGGFNAPIPAPRTLLLQIDLSKAFDMVNHNKLIKIFRSQTCHLFTKDGLTAIYVADNPESNLEAKHQLPEM